MFIHSIELNPCKCGSELEPNLDSDDMVPCWTVMCRICGQVQHDSNWTMHGAVEKWNIENPVIEEPK